LFSRTHIAGFELAGVPLPEGKRVFLTVMSKSFIILPIVYLLKENPIFP